MELAFPVIKTYYESSLTKIAWYWHMNREKDCWNGTEIQETDLSTYGNHVCSIGNISIHWGKYYFFINGVGKQQPFVKIISFSNTKYKNKLKINQLSKYIKLNYINTRRKHQ